MSELIEKLQQEKLELGGKIKRLNDFIRSDDFSKLDKTQRNMLLIQENGISKYYSALNIRIGLLLNEDAAKLEDEKESA